MTVVEYIDLDGDEYYVKVNFVDLSSEEDSVEKDANVEEDDNVARSENVVKAAVSSLISEQDATPATSLSKLEQEQPATTSMSTAEHGATTSSILAEETMQTEHQKFLATSNVSEESTRFENHGLTAVGDFVAEAMQSEHEAVASVFSSMTEQGGATSLLLTKQGAISSSLREDRVIQSGNQVFVAAVYCTEEATKSESTAKATVVPSMTEIGSTYKIHQVEQLSQMIGWLHIVEDAGNAMGSTGIYNRQAHEEPEEDGEKDENCDFEAEPEVLCQEVSQDVFAMSLSPVGKEKEISRFKKFYARKGKKQANIDNGSECCMVKGCTNGAHGSTPLCIFHNSKPRKRCCAVIGCTKEARRSSQGPRDRCIKHGGGKRCKYDGCEKGAIGKTNHCIAHGGGRRCEFEGCGKGAQGRTDYCIKHGGGTRCKLLGCRASATYGKDFCASHSMLTAQMNSESGLDEGSPPRKFRKLAEMYTESSTTKRAPSQDASLVD